MLARGRDGCAWDMIHHISLPALAQTSSRHRQRQVSIAGLLADRY